MREMKLTAVINLIVLILIIRFKSNIRDVAINPFNQISQVSDFPHQI